MSETHSPALQDVFVTPVPNGDAFDIKFVGADGNASSFRVTPDTFSMLLTPVLALLTSWSQDPSVLPQVPESPARLLKATQLVLSKGRTSTEGYVRVFVGVTEIGFLLPLDEVARAVLDLIAMLDIETGTAAH